MISPDNLSVVGHPSITRVDALGKSVGEAVFTEDIILPRMLVGRILRSPYAHARIVSIDTTAARNLPGVKAVITGAEAPTVKLGLFVVDEEVLNVSKVRFVGDHVAAVAAVDEDTAEEALRLITVEYEPLPAVYDPTEALRPDAPRIHDGENNIGAQEGIAGGNFIILAENQMAALAAAENAVDAISEIEGTITPFPGGIVGSGSKTGANKYKFLKATTNEKFCPSIKNKVEGSKVPKDVNGIYEIVINGLDQKVISESLRAGIKAAVKIPGVKRISAGNYGGTLGPHKFNLHELF